LEVAKRFRLKASPICRPWTSLGPFRQSSSGVKASIIEAACFREEPSVRLCMVARSNGAVTDYQEEKCCRNDFDKDRESERRRGWPPGFSGLRRPGCHSGGGDSPKNCTMLNRYCVIRRVPAIADFISSSYKALRAITSTNG